MIPAPFDYVRVDQRSEACALLAECDGRAAIVAGGHSLLPEMKLRRARPPLLVDIAAIEGLRAIHVERERIRIGALARHADLLRDARIADAWPVLRAAAAQLGDIQVRNRGTLGGSLVHADPAADWPPVMLALDATLLLARTDGERQVRADEFFLGPQRTARAADELLTEIRLPAQAAGLRGSYRKLRHPASGWALVGVAAVLGCDGDRISEARIGVTGVAERAYRATAVEDALVGAVCERRAVEAAARRVTDGVAVRADGYADAAYRGQLAGVACRQAILDCLPPVD